MAHDEQIHILDPLYGEISFDSKISDLILSPLVQRLRHVRLSNIDSMALPGISCVSRYEHTLGVSHLASRSHFFGRLTATDGLVIRAAALLHDSAITPFGHLLEEAFAYCASSYHHESKWSILASDHDEDDPAGIDLQIYLGHTAGFSGWCQRHFGKQWRAQMERIVQAIAGEGPFGKYIAGDVDVDNLDNVVRAAFHMGLNPQHSLPLRVVEGTDIDAAGQLTYSDHAIVALHEWLELRSRVYEKFMLSRLDFAGKTMLLAASVLAIESGVLSAADWKLSDPQFLQRLLQTDHSDISQAVTDWLLGKVWPLARLHWFDGEAPKLPELRQYALAATRALDRHCFAYRIKDKRHRRILITTHDGTQTTLGTRSDQWVLGVASSARRPFNQKANATLLKIAENDFGWRHNGEASESLGQGQLFR